MSSRREASTPPTIPGYSHVGLLGMGGFADVFLYEQHMPRRSVAVKVLLAGSLSDAVRERFRLEADLMARLSHHPSIVTIHHADVAADGRPYLVMEHCSRPGLGERYRNERMAVAEVLRMGVRLASAVETAHRAGVLHRDIKPANVLITDFGWPALTDFGIAATTGWSTGSAVGMSIPWAPPELLGETPHGDERSDVYSLAATVYSLLARRSPFEVPGGGNSSADLIARIERSPLAPTGRADVPASLHAVLERAMDKDPARRHPSALAFARALQQVEAELMLPLTALDLAEERVELPDEDTRPAADGEAAQATRLRPVRSVSAAVSPTAAQEQEALRVAAGTEPADPADAHEDDVPEAWQRDAAALPTAPEAGGRRSWGRVVAGSVAGLVVVAAVATGAVLAFSDDDPTAVRPTPTSEAPAARQPAVRAVPSPTELAGTLSADGTAVFSWANPDPADGDRYLWGVVLPGTSTDLDVVDEPTVTVPVGAPDDDVCIEVSIVRADGRMSTAPAVGCAEP
ncbi:serine/threonine-protein kinase [Cellulomonas carbonis]|uniref:non-specific serine/threonine protein kinase n=1 Tax=Cellulomonas carbonis T26 TaxID=947969 RepID=A0A0A0BLD3_9CELL|nr:serine/threonine-protein kinase [Cellulomonas carbonis]KGM09328.1 serine/threonine protein kinase [Cellulomonas carbonis T26]GGC09506.1 hypothetical protein GCM10010972_23500 [Cellulomonas carbonis]